MSSLYMSVAQTAKRLPDVFCLAQVASIPALLCLHPPATYTKPTSRKHRYIKDITYETEMSGDCVSPLLLDYLQKYSNQNDSSATTQELSLFGVIPLHNQQKLPLWKVIVFLMFLHLLHAACMNVQVIGVYIPAVRTQHTDRQNTENMIDQMHNVNS